MKSQPVEPLGGLLAVHAHPDDETLATGALLATWASAGEPVTVVTCTRGEQGEVIGAALAHLEGDGPALAAHRERELASALASLGVVDHVFLDQVPLSPDDARPENAGPDGGYRDSGMAWAAPGIARAVAASNLPDGAFVAVPVDEAARRLASVIRSRRPRVVVTYEPDGGYGHPDHVRAHEVTLRAVEIAARPDVSAASPHTPGAGAEAGLRRSDERWSVAEVWQAVTVSDTVRASRRELADLPEVQLLLTEHPELSLPDPDEPLPPVAKDPRDLPSVQVVATSPVLDAVLGALQAHQTQVQHVTAARPVAARPAIAEPGATQPAEAILGWYALSNGVLAPLLAQEVYAQEVHASSTAAPRDPHRSQGTVSDDR